MNSSITIFGSRAKYWTYNPTCTRTIVVLHGFRGTHHGLLDIIAELPDFRVIVPDLPGFGESTPMTEHKHSIEGYAQFALSLVRELKLAPTIILGHSMGTQIAAQMVAIDPTVASCLLLINPIAAHPLSGLGHIKMAPGVLYHWLGGKVLPTKLGNLLLTNRMLFLLGSATMTKTKDPALRRKIHNNHMTYMSRFSDRHTLLEAYEASISSTVTAHAAQITMPTLLIAGEIDAIAPIGGQRKLAALLPQGQLVVLKNVGHIVHYEQPRQAAAAINAFLTSKLPKP